MGISRFLLSKRAKGAKRLSEEIELLHNSPLVDPVWYRQTYPDLGAKPIDVARHYLEFGAAEGRNPHPLFDTRYYLEENPDVRAAGINPLVHYIQHGAAEGRKPHQPFDDAQYVKFHPDVNFEILSPLEHCVQSYSSLEWRSGVAKPFRGSSPPVPSIVAKRWAGEDNSPYSHEKHVISAEFDVEYYLRQNPEMSKAEAIEHFIDIGWRKGCDPNADFSVRDYLSLNPDVRHTGQNPLYHFITFGRSEGRSARLAYTRTITPSQALAPILFVGHDGIKNGSQVVLLEIVRWYAEHTRRPIYVLLLDVGRLVSEYARYANVFVFHNDISECIESDVFKSFIDRPFVFSYVNTAASGAFHAVYDRFLKAQNVPLVWHVHELSSVIYTLIDSFNKLKARAAHIIAVSEKVKTCLIEEFGCDKDKVFLSNAFIRPIALIDSDTPTFRKNARASLGLDENDFVIMGCGTVYSRKGPDLFVETAAKVIATGLAPTAKFVWMGDGPDLEEYRSIVAGQQFLGRVEFTGFHSNANELLAAADVFYLTSREDPFPLVSLEAAQFGVPTLYFTDATGISEFIREDAGIGIPAFDTGKGCSTLCALATDRSALTRMGAVARTRVLGKYTAETKIKEISRHIQSLTKWVPDVSIIVPAYNSSPYIEERMKSILDQTIQDFEIIVLDDFSTDKTVDVVVPFTADPAICLIRNGTNSGTPFKQWKLGSDLAKSPILWIAEADDSASQNFLETLLPAFENARAVLAFCPSTIMNSEGEHKPGLLDPYYALSTFPFRDEEALVDGFCAVEQGFGSMCLIVNASSVLMRKSAVTDGIGVAAASFKMSGDWLVYLHALRKGQLFYSGKAQNYFRRHTESMVHKTEGTSLYFDERSQIASFVVNNFNLSRGSFQRLLALSENEWFRFREKNRGQSKESLLRHGQLRLARSTRWKTRPLRIGFYVHGMLFSKGGIERLAAELANELTRRGHAVWIFCRVWGSLKPVYELNRSVQVVPIFDENDIERSIPFLRLEVARHDLDCFVPMLSEWLFDPVVEAVDALDIPIVASEHNDPWKIEELWWSREKRIACYERVAAVHLLLERFRESVPKNLRQKVSVIPNGIRLSPEILAAPIADRPFRFIGVGRLAPQKRFDRLIQAFSRISSKLPEWRLDIFGEGSERASLQALIDSHALGDSVRLRGASDAVLQELAKSSVFVIPSEFEGFGIVVIEAKMAGLPAIGYSDCNGPNELIRNDVDGLLVSPDNAAGEALGSAMLELASNVRLRTRLAAKARESLSEFDLENIAGLWEELLMKVAASSRQVRPLTKVS